eukprot:5566095-Amphidinium_carterae.1
MPMPRIAGPAFLPSRGWGCRVSRGGTPMYWRSSVSSTRWAGRRPLQYNIQSRLIGPKSEGSWHAATQITDTTWPLVLGVRGEAVPQSRRQLCWGVVPGPARSKRLASVQTEADGNLDQAPGANLVYTC